MSIREVGTCRNQPCGQIDLLWEDGYCSEDCRAQGTGCPVPGCRCAGGCGTATPGERPPEREGLA
jgi:hypothetical protein